VGLTILYCTEFISSAYPGVLERCCWSCPNFLAFISVKRNRSTPSGKERFGWGFFVLAKSWWQEGRRTGKLDEDGQGWEPGGGRTEWPPQSSVSAAYSCAARSSWAEETRPSFGFVYANKVRDKLLFCLNFVAAWSLGLLQLPLLLFQHYNFSSLSHNSSLFVRAL